MSAFYESLPYAVSRAFKERKKAFKRGKPCAICGMKYHQDDMMVAHKVPVTELSDADALLDESNWEVRCIYCERRLNHIKDNVKKIKEQNERRENEENISM